MVNEISFNELTRVLEAEIITGRETGVLRIMGICASDLMSDVLSFSQSGYLLLTSLVNLQTIRTADVTELSAICFVHGKRPDQDVIKLAGKQRLVLFASRLSMYEACGRLYQFLLPRDADGCN